MSQLNSKFIASSVVAIAIVTLFFALTATGDDDKESALVANTIVPQLKEFKIDRKITKEAQDCITCHTKESKGIVADWASSRHAHSNITCVDCHIAGPVDKDVSTRHMEYSKIAISAVVSPKDCSRCHPSESAEYAKSKHANTIELINKIDPWINHGLNNDVEKETGCYHCHGSEVKITDGKFDSTTWPNVGVGRINPDGSKGSCSSCHTRHKFSLAEARKPEACGQCHLGPDHPQIEIFHESKHGAIYAAEGQTWNWDAAPGSWTAGVDYRAPSCSVCHMSGVNGLKASHDVTERLSWETQAPVTVRPADFKPWPAQNDWKEERAKMVKVCLACHSQAWADSHFERLDRTVHNYNEVYFMPTQAKVDELYEKGLADKTLPMDEKIEIELYELWHHEGRRARFGAAMMAPDYAWWHGFYEMKKRCMVIDEEVEKLLESGKPGKIFNVRGTSAPLKKK
ncbi:MAG: hydroxylamine oxidoreductase [Phycisphaerae bacterium]|nr:hydroxylamine oxidoreductase [Phycisphaerae bacterium]